MSSLRDAAEDHLVMRRALGFKLTTWGRHLRSFIDYCETHHADHLTTELALAWPSKPQASVFTAGDHCADRRGGVGSRRHFGLPRTRR